MKKRFSGELFVKRSISHLLLVIGILSLLEWILKIPFLFGLYPVTLPTSPDTAVIIILYAIPFYSGKLLVSKKYRALLALSSIYGLLSVLGYILRIDLTTSYFTKDEILGGYPAWHMSPVSGILIFLSGMTLFLSDYFLRTPKRQKILFYLGILISFSGFIIMTGYLYHTPFLYGSEIIPVPFLSSVSFFLLGYRIRLVAGNVFFRRDAIVGQAASGLIKAIIPVVAGSIFLEGWLMETWTHIFKINHALYVSVVVLTLIIFISVCIYQISKTIFKTAIQFETELKKEHHFNQLLLDHMVEGVIACDENGIITSTNRVMSDWLGYDLQGEKLGHPYTNLELFSDNGSIRLNPDQTPLYRAFHGEQLHNLGLLIKGKQVKYVHVSGTPLYDDKNNRYGAVVTLHDITESKDRQRERAVTLNLLQLLNKSNTLHELIRSVTMFVKELAKCDAVGIRFRDEKDFPYYETTGFAPDFVLKEKYLCVRDRKNKVITDDSGRPLLECVCGSVLSGRVDSSKPFFTPNGSFHANSTALQLADTNNDENPIRTRYRCQAEGYESVALIPLRVENEVLGLIQLNDKRRDFFSRTLVIFLEQLSPYIAIALLQRRTKADLTESEEKYRSLAETTDDYIMRYDEHCRYIYINPAGLNLLGLNAGQILGKSHSEAGLDPSMRLFCEEKIKEIINTKETFHTQFQWESQNGPVYLDWKLKPEFDTGGNIRSVLGVSRDITLHKKAEQDLFRAKEKAEQNDNLKSAFLANMSHEIRTPINAILGFSELLMKTVVSDESYRQYAEIIYNRSNYLLGLIEDILDLSKVEAGILSIRCEPFNLNRLLDEIATQTKMKLQKMNRNLELKFIKERTDQESTINTDRKRLQQILINLIDNAIKFTKKGSITIRYQSRPGKGIVFSVADTGTGIPEDKIQFIFERFQRSDDSNLNSSGLGLGLSICRGMMKLLGGKIWVESEVNRGSVFSFNIPVKFMEQPVEEAVVVRYSEEPQIKGPVLIIDDDESNRELLKNVLKDFDLIFAMDGVSALEAFEKNPEIRLILVDIGLPDMNGKEIIKKIRRKNRVIPVFVLTAYAGDNEKQDCKESGCSEFFIKPVDIPLLIKKVSACLSQ